MSKFAELSKINVNDKIEKKNGLSYLSWAYAVDVLLTNDPSATWEYKEPQKFGETLMVFCSVKAFDKTMTAQLPVMDFRNKAIPNPDAFAVNTAMQRCLAKAIALHGLGLYIYAGEDLPQDDKIPPPKESAKSITKAEWETLSADEQNFLQGIADTVIMGYETFGIETAVKTLDEAKLDNDEKVAIWSRFDSKLRSAIKQYNDAQRKSA